MEGDAYPTGCELNPTAAYYIFHIYLYLVTKIVLIFEKDGNKRKKVENGPLKQQCHNLLSEKKQGIMKNGC